MHFALRYHIKNRGRKLAAFAVINIVLMYLYSVSTSASVDTALVLAFTVNAIWGLYLALASIIALRRST